MVFIAMFTMFVVLLLICLHYETAGSPILHHLGIDGGNMEGKETRFGIAQSALFTTITTALRLVLLTTCMTVSHLWVAWLQ